jgi:hypothetical protein
LTPDAVDITRVAFLSCIVAPGWNPVPTRFVILTTLPRAAVAGVILENVGRGLLTVKVPEDPELPSKVLVTLTSHVEVPVAPVPT